MAPVTFTVAEIARAAGMLPDTLRTWFKRRHTRPFDEPGDSEPAGKGLPRLFGRRTTERLILMAALVRLGMRPDDAGRAVRAWEGQAPARGRLLLVGLIGGDALIIDYSCSADIVDSGVFECGGGHFIDIASTLAPLA